jgi:hypothetical protein
LILFDRGARPIRFPGMNQIGLEFNIAAVELSESQIAIEANSLGESLLHGFMERKSQGFTQ